LWNVWWCVGREKVSKPIVRLVKRYFCLYSIFIFIFIYMIRKRYNSESYVLIFTGVCFFLSFFRCLFLFGDSNRKYYNFGNWRKWKVDFIICNVLHHHQRTITTTTTIGEIFFQFYETFNFKQWTFTIYDLLRSSSTTANNVSKTSQQQPTSSSRSCKQCGKQSDRFWRIVDGDWYCNIHGSAIQVRNNESHRWYVILFNRIFFDLLLCLGQAECWRKIL
jgi:hypothetical protein